MDIQDAVKAITESLSVKTHEKVMNHIEREEDYAKSVMENYFKDLLNFRFNNELSMGEKVLWGEMKQLKELLEKAGNVTEFDEDLRGKLVDIYCDGYLMGYISAVKDTEAFIYSLDDGKEAGEE